jgi:hypothetical protein
MATDGDLLEVNPVSGKATTFDAWEKRDEFFRLKRGNTQALLAFLRSVGFFARPEMLGAGSRTGKTTIVIGGEGLHSDVPFVSKISEKDIWEVRRLIIGSLGALGQHTGQYHDFQVRMVPTSNGAQRLVLTTTTFLEALLLTLSVDQLKGARKQKCARPDCGIQFSITSRHKRKYCQWECGHIESVRKQRRKAKRAPGHSKSTLAMRRGKRDYHVQNVNIG